MEKKEKLYEQVYNDICSKIKSGELHAGDRLPTEEQMTRIYGVSRITVTKALTELKKNQIIVRATKRGTFINPNMLSPSNKEQLLIPLVIILPEEENLNHKILEGIQNVALSNNVVVSFYNTYNDLATERNILSKLARLKIDGLLLFPCSEYENLNQISELAVTDVPIVFIDRKVYGIPGPCVTSDNRNGMAALVDKLCAQGHRRIGFAFLHDFSNRPETERFEGYCMSLIRNKLPVDERFIFRLDEIIEKNPRIDPQKWNLQKWSNLLSNCAYAAVDAWLKMESRPTAICCVNDNEAYQLITAFESKLGGLPPELVITGFDNLSYSKLKNFTTVEQDFYTIGKTAIETILQNICYRQPSDDYIRIETKIIPR